MVVPVVHEEVQRGRSIDVVDSAISVVLWNQGLPHKSLTAELSVSVSAVEIEQVPVLARCGLVESVSAVSVLTGSESEHSVVPSSRGTCVELLDDMVVWVDVVRVHDVQVGVELGEVGLRPA